MRRSVYPTPRIAPCFRSAIIAYWEHVGVNRQFGPSKGERIIWYRRMIATRTLLITRRLSWFQETPHSLGAFVEVQGRCFRPRHDDNMHVLRELGAMGPVEFAQEPLDAIPHHCRADFSRYSQPEFPAFTFPPSHITNERGPHALSTVPKHDLISALLGEPLTPWKPLWPRHNRLAASSLQRQPLTALCAPTVQYRTTARGRTTRTKPVRPLALNVRWLKSTLHRILLLTCTDTTPPPVGVMPSRSPASGLSMCCRLLRAEPIGTLAIGRRFACEVKPHLVPLALWR